MLDSNMDIVPVDRYRWSFLLLFLIVSASEGADNIALLKNAEQSSTRSASDGAAKAVDGCTNQVFSQGCCTHTAAEQSEVWWRVDLGRLSVIENIVIYYRDNFQSRLAGYELYVSNTTDKMGGVLCFMDSSTSLSQVQLTQTLQCPYTGQYVIIYNKRGNPKRFSWYSDNAFLELCEVQVFGCQVGKYGSRDCDTNCSNACLDYSCNSVSGSCLNCISGTYGSFCEHNCSAKCGSPVCEKDNGHCFNCTSGKHGDTCEMDCPSSCLDNLCFQNSGFCLSCIAGKYGPRCESFCSDYCEGDICIQDSGFCEGCKAGKYGRKCESNCPDDCEGNICIQDSGFCEACVKGFYGNRCDTPCLENCAECRQDSGNCTACNNGFYGDTCEKECPNNCAKQICNSQSGICGECKDGYFGYRCDTTCNSNCRGNRRCGRTDGICEEGCDDGIYGLKCDQICPVDCKSNICHRLNGTCTECNDGQYGNMCELQCPKHCESNICEKGSGVCAECIPGKYGFRCENTCPVDCNENACGRIDGKCEAVNSTSTVIIAVLACLASVFFLATVSLIVVVVRLWKNMRTKNQEEPHYTDIGPVNKNTQHVYEMATT